MSISEQEQQALECIESDLAISGPGLAAMLAMFGRLTAGEEMPAREKVWRAAALSSAGPVGGASTETQPASVRPIVRWLGKRVAWRLLWLVAAIAMIASALAFDRGAAKGICTASRTAACVQAPAPAPGRSGAGAAGP